MPVIKATEKALASAPIGEHKIAGIPCLYLRVSKTGRRVWVTRSKVSDGNGGLLNSVVTLGPTTKLSLKDVRLKCALRSPNRLEGRVTVSTVVDEHLSALQAGWRPNTIMAYKRYGIFLMDRIGGRPIADLTRQELVFAINSYLPRGATATNRLLAYAKTLFNWAVEAGFLEHSPAVGLTRRIAGGGETSRDRVLNDAEIRELWGMTSRHARLLRALLLTGCRVSELRKAQWKHYDKDKGVLTIPTENAKSKKARPVYLNDEITSEFDGTGLLLFSSCDNTGAQAFLRHHGGGWTPHDLRRTFTTLAASVGVSNDLIRRLIGHADNTVLGVYLRYDFSPELRAATELVRNRVLSIVTGPHRP